mgnify:CR=1 FL=1
MPLNLRLAVLIVTLILAFAIYKVLSKRMIPIKYSFLWWLAVVVLLVLVVIPDVLIWFANQLGFQTISNLVVGVFIVILFFITVSLTVIVSAQKRKITLLIQEVSILKEKIK